MNFRGDVKTLMWLMWHAMLHDSDFMMCWEKVDGGSFSFPQVFAFLLLCGSSPKLLYFGLSYQFPTRGY